MTEPDRQAATLSALALIEAEFTDGRDLAAETIVGGSTEIELIHMLGAAVSLAAIVTRQLGNLVGDTDGVIRALRESIEQGYTDNPKDTTDE